MKYVYCLLALFLVGCGKPETVKAYTVSVDANLVPYLDKFTQDIGVGTDGISAGFTSLTLPTIGQCLVYDNGVRAIQIDKTYWASANDNQKEQLMFHELGHCAMGLQHIPDLNGYGCPVSIMYPYEFGESPCYTTNKPYYYGELASHKQEFSYDGN